MQLAEVRQRRRDAARTEAGEHRGAAQRRRAERDLASQHARIGVVIFSETPWTIENEILTPTMKIRREQIEKQFGEDAERLAREGAEAGSILMHWAD